MGFPGILRGFGASLIALSLAMLPALFVAVSAGEPTGPFIYGGAITLLTGGGLWIASWGRGVATDFRSVLLVVLLWWTIAPAFAALPFILEGMSFADAYFDAVSAITTTGAWISNDAAIAVQSAKFWRAELQWLGGLASISIAAAVFVRPEFFGINTLMPPFSRGEQKSSLRPLRDAILAFWWVYALITFFCFAVLAIAGAPTIDAMVIAFSAASTGGFIPHEQGLAAYSPLIPYLLFPFIVIGGANFIVLAQLFRGAFRQIQDNETSAFLLMILGVGILFWLTAGAESVDQIAAQIFNAGSLLSTNGMTIGERPTLPVAIVAVMIGGSAVSSAGGFKVLRWLVIMRRTREEIRRLVQPSAVFGSKTISHELSVWMHFLVFTMVLAALVLVITFGGHSFELAATAAAATLSNAGPLLGFLEQGEQGYAIFDENLRWVLIAAMILGRLEAAAALALINRAFWRS